ncbi:MAG: hypothetical protein AAGH88_08825 [Planctomycetota bacterium]
MMGQTRSSLWFLCLTVIVSGVVASTAIRIECYNHAVGGFLPRPQPPSMEGNNIKWRVSGPSMAERSYRQSIARDQGFVLSDDFETRSQELQKITLTNEQQQELLTIKRQVKLDADFRAFVSTMGLLQYLLVPLGFFCSVLAIRRKTQLWISLGMPCLFVNFASGGLMLYRGYSQSLGL